MVLLETADGFKLGSWVMIQRVSRKGQGENAISAEQMARLDVLDFVWDVFEFKWELGLKYLAAYVQKHGDAMVLQSFVTADGFKLGSWVMIQRVSRKGQGENAISAEQMARLDVLDFVWDVFEFKWELGLKYLAAYVQKHGDAMVPHSFVAAVGFNLGTWVNNQRAARKERGKFVIMFEQMARLDALGFV
eukprot:TRINITY_DN20685_c0_g1_i1.p1 TRINITY_DN20685_c0_g1~~TRINITY_DN20685_c0_g1_i1.p1  ORF type:complete len:190 (-),score=60.54 TRINITY_DN20685_c0_g1_i1:24-593(-)